MGAVGLARRLWEGLWNRQSLGRIVIKFYPQGSEASITVSPTLAALSRRYWHWLYLQHLAESLAAIGETQERVRLLVAARAMAEDFVTRSYWPHVIGEGISDASAGAAGIVLERSGGVALTAQAIQRDDGMPTIRLTWSPPQARERIASSNLVLLVHVMKGAPHPLEQYEIFRKIALFADYCERAGCPRERGTLQGGVLYAVVHTDLTEVASPRGSVRQKASALSLEAARDARGRREVRPDSSLSQFLTAARSFGDRLSTLRASLASLRAGLVSIRAGLASPEAFWKRSSAAIGAAAVVWVGLVVGAFFLPRFGGPARPPQPMTSVPAGPSHVAVTVPDRKDVQPQAQIPRSVPGAPQPVSRVATRPGAGVAQRPRPSPDREGSDLPKFRVVSGTLALDVAEHRSKILAEQGVDAFVHERAGKLGRLQYGAYRSRETAEEDARHLRAQGYTAVVIPW